MDPFEYREHAPPAPLAAIVECLWTVRSAAPATPQRILPDGSLDLVFALGEARSAAAVGAMTRALAVRHAGPAEFVGVRFRPGCAAPLGLPAAELTDRSVPLGELGGRLVRVAGAVLDAASAEEALRRLPSLLGALAAGAPRPQPVAAAAWARLRASAGAIPVRALAAELGVGERRLQRIFREHVGLTPKEAARVARLRAALAILRAEPALPLGRVALRAGYFDQPHFNREFARLAGVAPGAWRVASVQSPGAPAA